MEDEKLGLIYAVRVKLASAPSGIQPAVCMIATADIRNGERPLLSYLVSPIKETCFTAGRERLYG